MAKSTSLFTNKNRKLSNVFIKNNIHKDPSNSHVVYQYVCPGDMCRQSQTYIGYTTTSLKQRMTMHAQTGSIISHLANSHENRPRTAEIQEHVKILFKSHDKIELTLAEAILIKQISPTMNNQREGETRVLRVF